MAKNEEQKLSGKEMKGYHVAECIFTILLQSGISGVTHARLSRAAGVSRPWLYKYVGSKREDLIIFGIDHFGKIFAEIDRKEPSPRTKQEYLDQFFDATARVLEYTKKYPWIVLTYFHFRDSQNIVGDRVRYLVNLYLARQIQDIMRLFNTDKEKARSVAEIFSGMRMGLAFTYIVTGMDKKLGVDGTLKYVKRFIQLPKI